MEANTHPIKVTKVADEGFYANSHPYKVVIEGGGGQEGRVVDELPEEGEVGYIYLVLKEESEEGDIYDEYMWVLQADGETYGWEHIGATNEVTIVLYDTPGTNTDGAMTQDATTKLVFPDATQGNSRAIAIGNNATAAYSLTSEGNIAIGHANSSGGNSIAISGNTSSTVKTNATGTGAIAIGSNSQATGGYSVAIGRQTRAATYSYALGHIATASGTRSIAIGASASATANSSMGIAGEARHAGSIAIGEAMLGYTPWQATTSRENEVSFGGYTNDNIQYTHYLANITAGELDTDAVNLGQMISYQAINGSGAPTTATEGKYVGQLYYDTTNDDMYYCSAITAQGTDPETYTYTWSTLGGGGGGATELTTADYDFPTDNPAGIALWNLPDGEYYMNYGSSVRLYGSTNGYLSAVTGGRFWIVKIGSDSSDYNKAIFGIVRISNSSTELLTGYVGNSSINRLGETVLGTPTTNANGNYNILTMKDIYHSDGKTRIQIGNNANAQSTTGETIAIGVNASTASSFGGNIAIGWGAKTRVSGMRGAVALGSGANATRDGEVNIGGVAGSGENKGYNGTAYRVIGGVHPGVDDHDAVTVAQMNDAIAGAGATVLTNTEFNNLWENA